MQLRKIKFQRLLVRDESLESDIAKNKMTKISKDLSWNFFFFDEFSFGLWFH